MSDMKFHRLTRSTLFFMSAMLLVAFAVLALYLQKQNFFSEPSLALDEQALSSAESMSATGEPTQMFKKVTPVKKLNVKNNIKENVLPEDGLPASTELSDNTLALWQTTKKSKTLEGGVKGFEVVTENDAFSKLNVDKAVSLAIPDFNEPLHATINKTYNETGGVEMYQGEMFYDDAVSFDDELYSGHRDDNIVIAKGKIKTHVTIATRKATYSLIIDNASGKGTLINEAEYIAQQSEEINDAVRVTHVDDSAPAF